MQFQSNLPLPCLTWEQIQEISETRIAQTIRKNPEPSFEKLISDLDTSQVTTALAEKAFKAMNRILVPGSLFERLSSALCQKGIFSQQQVEQFKAKQQVSLLVHIKIKQPTSSSLIDLKEALKDNHTAPAHIISLVEQGQTLPSKSMYAGKLLDVLCNSPLPRHPHVKSLIVQLIKDGLEPSAHQDQTELLAMLCEQTLPWEENVKKTIRVLIRRATQLPQPLPNPEHLLAALCEATPLWDKNIEDLMVDLVQWGHPLPSPLKHPQDTLNALLKSKLPWNAYTLNAICSLIEAKLIPSHQALEKLVTVRNYHQCLAHAALILVRAMKNFPDSLLLNPDFFFFLCQNVSKGDKSLYPAIRQVIELNDNCDMRDENKKIPFDYFLENGGNLAILFQNLSKDLQDERSYSYLDTPTEFYESLGRAEMMFILYNSEVRPKFLGAENLEFLKDSLLIALAQFCNMSLRNDSQYVENILQVMQKFTLLQQEAFLTSLSQQAREKLQQAFSLRQDFKKDRKFLSCLVAKLIAHNQTLNDALNQLQATIPQNTGLSILEEADIEREVSELSISTVLVRLQAIVRKMSVWTNDPRFEAILPYIGLISANQMQLPNDPELKAQAKLKADAELKALNDELSKSDLINQKYQVAYNAAIALLNPEAVSLEEIDYDKLVSKLFDGVTIQAGPCPSQRGDEQDKWKKNVKGQFEGWLQFSFSIYEITTLKQLIAWIETETKRTFDQMEKPDHQADDVGRPRVKRVKTEETEDFIPFGDDSSDEESAEEPVLSSGEVSFTRSNSIEY